MQNCIFTQTRGNQKLIFFFFAKYKSPRGTIQCNTIEAEIDLREEKPDSAMSRSKFQECLISVWETDNQAKSFCLESLADIRPAQGPEVLEVPEARSRRGKPEVDARNQMTGWREEGKREREGSKRRHTMQRPWYLAQAYMAVGHV
jgi:hypothetical protein